MKKWFGYIAFTLLCYIVFLLATLPASQLYGRVQAQLPGLHLNMLEGTIWQGEAKQAQISNQQFGPLYWQFNPFALFLGKLEYQISTTGTKLRSSGHVGYSVISGPYLSDCSGDTDAATINAFFRSLPIQPQGRINFDISQAQLAGNRLSSITGNITWKGAGVTQPVNISLGNLNMALETDQSGVIQGKITDQGGELSINGQLDLQPDGRFLLKGKITPKATTSQDLLNALNLISQADAKGVYNINIPGKLN